MQFRKTLAILTAALVAAACSDQPAPTEAPLEVQEARFARVLDTTNGLLSSIPVTSGLQGGGAFKGTLSITGLSLVDGQLLASGTLTGTAKQAGSVTDIVQQFTDVPLSLLSPGQNECDILHLELGPIDLTLLGLEVFVSRIVVDVDADPSGGLLGQLLCSLANLLDSDPLDTGAIQDLLDQINALLG